MFSICHQPSLLQALEVHQQIPELMPMQNLTQYQQRLEARPFQNWIATSQPRQQHQQQSAYAGYLLGYALNEDEFYLWLCGVVPEFRKQGVAEQLLQHAEKYCREQQYKTLRIKSMNRYPQMLRLLIRQGYSICDIESKQDPEQAKIHFCKSLSAIGSK